MHDLEYLVLTMQELMGPLPVTASSLQHRSESYLSWLHMVLSDLEEAHDMPDAPRLFSMLPQSMLPPTRKCNASVTPARSQLLINSIRMKSTLVPRVWSDESCVLRFE